jgi:ELWxxDGT repeat protein
VTKVFDTPGKYHWFIGEDTSAIWSLWRTDGTIAGTRMLRNGIVPPTAVRYHKEQGTLFFTTGLWSGGAEVDYEPWVSDGTPGGTQLLKDLRPDTSSGADSYAELGGDMLFLARGSRTPGSALWTSDGTAAGTRIVLEPEVDWLKKLQVVGDRAFVLSHPPFDDTQFSWWSTDGTPDGTIELARFEGVYDLRLSKDLGDGRSLWTLLDEDDPASLWVTDGTPAGTMQLMSLKLPSPYVHLNHFVRYRGTWYFTADDGTTGLELWRTDGTPDGTRVAFETCPGTCSDSPGLALLQPGDLLEVWLTDAEHGRELWATDGTLEGTRLLLDLCPGPCSPATGRWHDLDGLRLFFMRGENSSPESSQLWVTDLTPEGTQRLTELRMGAGSPGIFGTTFLNGRFLFEGGNDSADSGVWALPVGPFDPPAPLGDWLASPEAPGFSFKVRISTPSGSILGTKEPACISETVCVSGALPGRSEVFLRVVGPKPNGFLWPTLVKFSTSTVEVWVRQEATGLVRYYRLEGARPGFDELPGLFDRQGFQPVAQGAASTGALLAGLVAAEPTVLAAGDVPAPPAGAVFTSPHFPDFRFRARISAGDQVQEVRQEAACIEETLCLSAALPGRSEVFLRIVGPKPNGRLWPTIVKFTTSTLEVWVEQVSAGETRYYRIEGAEPGKDDLTGLFDRAGFAP